MLQKNMPHTCLIDASNDPGSEVARVNSLGHNPALIPDGETSICALPEIAEYVDTPHDIAVSIPPHDGPGRMRVKRWQASSSGSVDSAITVRKQRTRPAQKQEAGIIIQHSPAVSRALAHAATQLDQQEWCEGMSLTLDDLAPAGAVCILSAECNCNIIVTIFQTR